MQFRTYSRYFRDSNRKPNTLVIGAGAVATLLAHRSQLDPSFRIRPRGFIDADGGEIGRLIHGLPKWALTAASLIGDRQLILRRLKQIVPEYQTQELAIHDSVIA